MNAPLIPDFRSKAEKALSDLADGSLGMQAFRRALDAWRNEPDLTIEDFYTFIEVQARIGGPANGLVNDLRFLIGKTIEHSIGHDRSEIYQHLVEDRHGHDPSQVTFISFNWDIGLDNVLTREGGSVWPDYGPPRATSRGRQPDPNRQRVKLLKLHGSLNQWWCPDCKLLFYDPGQKSNITTWIQEPAPRCPTPNSDGHLQPLFVAPGIEKLDPTARTQILRHVWGAAQTALSGCSHLVVAGYSFGNNDRQFQLLMRAAIANAPLESITIVTDRKIGQEKVQFEERHAKLFHKPEHRALLDFEDVGFENWVLGQGLKITT